jgi:hypothetical protein
MIGEPNNQTTRDRLKSIVRTTVMEEPRIKEIVKIEVKSRLAILEQKHGVREPTAIFKSTKIDYSEAIKRKQNLPPVHTWKIGDHLLLLLR